MSEISWRGHRHLLTMNQFSRKDIEDIHHFSHILKPYSREGNKLSILKGSILQSVLFEHSTRTLKRHESAMKIMGGDCLSPHLSITSSMEKGESETDTVITYAQNADILAIRHPSPNSVYLFAERINELKNNTTRIINCGNGPDEHPTQALLDYHTIMEELGTLDDLIWLIVGDLEYGRPVHSHMIGTQKFSNNKIIGFPVGGLSLQKERRTSGYEEFDLDYLYKIPSEIPPDSNVVLYATRIQFERIARKRYPDYDNFDEARKRQIRDEIYREFQYQITLPLLDALPEKTRLLHPLPRGSEISDEVFFSNNPKVAPIEQIRYGVQTTMAYIALFSGKEDKLRKVETLWFKICYNSNRLLDEIFPN